MGDRLWVGKLSRYVTSYPGQLSLAIPLWVGAMSTSLGWEGNRSLASHWAYVTDNSGLSTTGLNSLRTPRLRSFGVWPSFTFTNISKTKPDETKAWFRLSFMPSGQEKVRVYFTAHGANKGQMKLLLYKTKWFCFQHIYILMYTIQNHGLH